MSIVHRDVHQGTPEWFALRRGIPTASDFHKIITPAKAELSKSARKYAYRLIAERLLNCTLETLEGQAWMDRGKELEPFAVKQLEFSLDLETEPIGFITTDDRQAGASPDRLIVGKPEVVEIKCPAPHTHVGYLLDGPGDDYRVQVQGQLYVAEAELAHFYSYSDRMPPLLLTTPRDEDYIRKLASALAAFNEQLADLQERAQRLGVFQAYEAVAAPTDLERAESLRRDMDAALREA